MRIQMLGRVAIVHDEQVVTVARSQTRGVLALLALNAGRGVSLEHLTDAMWGGTEPVTARAQIYSAISSVRRLFSETGVDATIVGGRFGYQLTVDPTDVDALRFERVVHHRQDGADPADSAACLREALTLWHGEPLADASGAFVAGVRVHLTERRLKAVDDLAALDLAAGRYADVVADLSALVAEYPAHEQLRGRLMIALFRCGRQAAALRLYHDYRHGLADSDGLDPGAALTAIADAILRDELPAAGPVAATDPVRLLAGSHRSPHALPDPAGDFVARSAELATIDATLRPGRPAVTTPVVTVTGMGGIGKTSLAVLAAHRAAESFPDGCLYADLRGSGPHPADPHVLIGTLLRAIGMDPDLIPADPGERVAVYRTRTQSLRLLLVLDDAGDEQQLRPLIPAGRGCAVVVTARAATAWLDGGTPVRLAALSEVDGGRLLSVVAGVARDQAGAIVRLCGGLPLALRIVGARLCAETDTDPGVLREGLADERRRLDQLSIGDRDVRSTLALSYRSLSAPAATLFAQLGALAVAETPAWVATCLTGGEPSAAERALQELTDAALVTMTRSGDERRYRLHQLVQLYAKELAEADGATGDGARRVYEALAGLIVDHDHHLHDGFPTQTPDDAWFRAPSQVTASDPTAWFSAERELVVAAIDGALERGWIRLAAQLLGVSTNLADMSDGPGEWNRLTERILPHITGRSGFEFEEAMLLLAYGGRLRDRGDFVGALPLLRRARYLFHRMDDPARAATSATEMAILFRRSRSTLAVHFFEWAIARFAVAGHPPHETQAHVGLGNLFLTTGRLHEARESYTNALAVVRRHGERTARLYPNVLGCLAEVLALEGHHREALERYHEAMAQAADIGDRKQWAQLQFQIARVHQRTGNPVSTAQAAWRAAQALDSVGFTGLADRARKIAVAARPAETRPAETRPGVVSVSA